MKKLQSDPNNLAYWCKRCNLRSECFQLPQDSTMNKYYATCYGRDYTNKQSDYSISLEYGGILFDQKFRLNMDLDLERYENNEFIKGIKEKKVLEIETRTK